MAIGIAMMGAGIFAREQHLPAIEACDLLELKAVYSRSQASAEALAAKATAAAKSVPLSTYFDEPAVDGRGLADLLARADVAAVAVSMPINLQPRAVRAALAAGKHVISEKPVADTVANARALVAAFDALPAPRPLWAVAENYRYQKSLCRAETELRALGGTLVAFRLESCKFVRPDGNYFNTSWRKHPTHPGGFLLDGGIHYVAALRALLQATRGGDGKDNDSTRIATVAGTMHQVLDILPPADTLRQVAVTAAGVSGTVAISFATEFGPPLEIAVTTTEGSVVWTPRRVTVTTCDPAAPTDPWRHRTAVVDCSPANPDYPADEATGVKAEFVAFAKSIAAGAATVDPRQSAAEALEDLRVIEAMFDSGAAGAQPMTIA